MGLKLIVISFSLIGAVSLAETNLRLTQEQWLRGIRKEVRTSLCDPQGYLRSCTTVSATCFASVERACDLCVPKQQFPRMIDPLNEGVGYAKNFGDCVGKDLEKVTRLKPGKVSSRCAHAY